MDLKLIAYCRGKYNISANGEDQRLIVLDKGLLRDPEIPENVLRGWNGQILVSTYFIQQELEKLGIRCIFNSEDELETEIVTAEHFRDRFKKHIEDYEASMRRLQSLAVSDITPAKSKRIGETEKFAHALLEGPVNYSRQCVNEYEERLPVLFQRKAQRLGESITYWFSQVGNVLQLVRRIELEPLRTYLLESATPFYLIRRLDETVPK